MSEAARFLSEVQENIERLRDDGTVRKATLDWIDAIAPHKYTYNFTWLGRPIIQFPQDLAALQEIIWATKPDLLIETGIAHGGSLIFHASMLHLLGNQGRVLGVDIDIRDHNRAEIEAHPMFERIDMIQGSSIEDEVAAQVAATASKSGRVMVILDSNHTHDHVLSELEIYAPLVSKGCYMVVFDTLIEDMPEGSFPDRPWDKGDNPRTAVNAFLEMTNRFEVDAAMDAKLQISVAPGGYLKCVAD
ncbi:MAG: cephalosporin hydroxylase family protein [Verrucomicrobiota bacterium]|nr:cephalosporin hydroxylase family protein [Verrucomicrobiota bacterium]MEE2813168.1 cephalosporin hydroxylase family protein [Verrucomicrobiota bacterium]